MTPGFFSFGENHELRGTNEFFVDLVVGNVIGVIVVHERFADRDIADLEVSANRPCQSPAQP